MMNQKSEKWKMFLLAFVPTLALLACIMVGVAAATQPTMPGGVRGSTPVQEEPLAFRPQASDSLTLAVIGSSGAESAESFLLIRFNPQFGQVPLTVLPPETIVSLDGAGMTLSQTFARGGGAAVKLALSERFGIKVDRYARLSTDAFLRVAEKTGEVVFALPEEIAYTNRAGLNIRIPAGERRLDGKDVADLFAYPALFDDPQKRGALLGNLVAALVNQNLSAGSENVSPGLFKLAVNLVDTDVSYADYEYRRDAADFVSGLEAQVAGNLAVDGSFLSGGASFELSEAYVDTIRRYFQPTH